MDDSKLVRMERYLGEGWDRPLGKCLVIPTLHLGWAYPRAEAGKCQQRGKEVKTDHQHLFSIPGPDLLLAGEGVSRRQSPENRQVISVWAATLGP